jgi:hypothetical protein
MNAQDHGRLRGKIEALVGKGDAQQRRLAAVIDGVLRRRAAGSSQSP